MKLQADNIFLIIVVSLSCLLIIVTVATAQVSIFEENKDYIEVSRDGKFEVYEYGYKIDHGTWYEEHVWFGKDEVEAMANMESNRTI